MKRRLAGAAIAAGVLELGWLLDGHGIRDGANAACLHSRQPTTPATETIATALPAPNVSGHYETFEPVPEEVH